MFISDRKELLKAVSSCAQFGKRYESNPLVSIEADKDEDYVCVTYQSASVHMEYAISGVITEHLDPSPVDGKDLIAALKFSKLDRVVIQANGDSLDVGTQGLLVVPFKAIPSLPLSDSSNFTVAGDNMVTALKAVKAAMSKDSNRFSLFGVNFALNDRALQLTATDGHRLSHVEVEVEQVGCWSGVIPAPVIAQMLTITEQGMPPIDFAVDGAGYRIAFPKVMFRGSLQDGTFPDFKRLFPIPAEKISFKVDDLVDVATRFNRLMKEAPITLAYGASEALNIGRPGCMEVMMGSSTAQPWATVSFNPRYLAEILNPYKGAVAEMQLNGEMAFITFPSFGDKHLIMATRA